MQGSVVMVVMTLGVGEWNLGSDSLSSHGDSLKAHPDPMYVAGCPVPDPLQKSSTRGGVGMGRGCTEEGSSHPITPRVGREADLADTCTEPKGKGRINSPRELLRPYLPRTRMRNRANREGWALGNQRATRERRSCSEDGPTPTNTVASGDESTMNVRGCTDFPGRPTRCELRRISLPRTTVNRGKKEPRSSYAPGSSLHCSFALGAYDNATRG